MHFNLKLLTNTMTITNGLSDKAVDIIKNNDLDDLKELAKLEKILGMTYRTSKIDVTLPCDPVAEAKKEQDKSQELFEGMSPAEMMIMYQALGRTVQERLDAENRANPYQQDEEIEETLPMNEHGIIYTAKNPFWKQTRRRYPPYDQHLKDFDPDDVLVREDGADEESQGAERWPSKNLSLKPHQFERVNKFLGAFDAPPMARRE